MKFHNTLDIVLNSILNLVLEKLPTDPIVATEGRIYFNTASRVIRFADGTNWQSIGQLSGIDILTLLDGNAGASSGLDADLLDGLEASAFSLAGHTHTVANITDFVAAVDGRITAALTGGAVDATVDTIAEFTQLIKDNQAGLAAVLSAKRFQENVGNNTQVSFTITHNLNTLDAIVQVIENSTGAQCIVDNTRTGVNTVVVDFATPPSINEFRVVIIA